jgi:hypothetical protein
MSKGGAYSFFLLMLLHERQSVWRLPKAGVPLLAQFGGQRTNRWRLPVDATVGVALKTFVRGAFDDLFSAAPGSAGSS